MRGQQNASGQKCPVKKNYSREQTAISTGDQEPLLQVKWPLVGLVVSAKPRLHEGVQRCSPSTWSHKM